MIGAPIGTAIGAAFPDNVATIYDQSVTVNLTASAITINSAGKIVTMMLTASAALGNFSIGKLISASVAASIIAIKAVSYTIAAASIGLAVSIVKSAGVNLSSMISVTISAVMKSVGAIRASAISLQISISKNVHSSITLMLSLGASIATLIRRGGPLYRPAGKRPRFYWKGRS